MPDFTAEQQDAIRYRELDACVVAGPGSGKTTVLVERYRSLVIDKEFKFSEILAITFTEKAAANMKAKIAEQFRYDPMRLRELDQAWIYTIHGFCARFLKENAIAAGIDPRFAVLDAREADDLQMECINAALDELTLQRRGEALALIEMLQAPRIGPDLKSAYDGIRSAGLSVAQVRRMANPGAAAASAVEIAARIQANVKGWPFKLTPTQGEHKRELLAYAARLAESDAMPAEQRLRFLVKSPIHLGRIPRDFKDELDEIREQDLKALFAQAVDSATAGYRSLIFDALEGFDALYVERKRARGVLDFNDLERHAIELLRGNESVRAGMRKQFRQIMLDEFQDINQQQSDLVALIRGADAFFAVGDLNQSIYGFRHARPDIFTRYREEVERSGKHSGQLMTNFRSRAEILKCVETLLNSADGIDPRDLVAGRTFDEKAQPSIEVIRALDQEEDEEDDSNREAKWIAYRVMQLCERLRFEFRDFAVLCRNGDSMKPILREFDRAGIPYVCGRRQSFLVSREGLDIAALLSTIANPRDGVALGTVLRSPLAGVSDEALMRARMMGSSVTSGLNAAALDSSRLQGFAPEDAEKLERFLKDLKRWRADSAPLDVRIVRMLTDCGYVWSPGTVAGDNVEAFLHLARTKGAGRTLPDFLLELESIEKGLSSESDLSDEDQGNCVPVMTAHAAKGLEFRVTIIAALHQGTRRGTPSVSFTPEHGLGMKWRNPFVKKASDRDALEDSWARANSDAVKRREDEEANRLFYVAMTRAEEHLILSYTVGKRRPQNWAALLDGFFGLEKAIPSGEPVTVARDGFEASVLVTDSDPPLLSNARAEKAAIGAEVVPRPASGARDETEVSVTSIAVFAGCPRKYFLQRYLGWSPRARTEDRDPDDGGQTDVSAADLGTAVHALLAGKPGPLPAGAVELANVFLRSELGMRAAASARSAREWDFIAEIEGAMVRGSVDLWFERDGAIEIVDYKTDAAIKTSEYAPQLALYAIAIEKAFGKRPAHAWLHFLRHDLVEEVAVDEADLAAARDLVRRLRAAQDGLAFELHEGPHCYSCPFHRSMCPAGL